MKQDLHGLFVSLALAGMLATSDLRASEAPPSTGGSRVDSAGLREAMKPLDKKMRDDHQAYLQAVKSGDKARIASARAAIRADMAARRKQREAYLKGHPEAAGQKPVGPGHPRTK